MSVAMLHSHDVCTRSTHVNKSKNAIQTCSQLLLFRKLKWTCSKNWGSRSRDWCGNSSATTHVAWLFGDCLGHSQVKHLIASFYSNIQTHTMNLLIKITTGIFLYAKRDMNFYATLDLPGCRVEQRRNVQGQIGSEGWAREESCLRRGQAG